jgi:hypothetical protein
VVASLKFSSTTSLLVTVTSAAMARSGLSSGSPARMLLRLKVWLPATLSM